jgi:hypothetical protein
MCGLRRRPIIIDLQRFAYRGRRLPVGPFCRLGKSSESTGRPSTRRLAGKRRAARIGESPKVLGERLIGVFVFAVISRRRVGALGQLGRLEPTADESWAVAVSIWVAGCWTGLTRESQKRSVPVVIVAGHITVEPQRRESYLAGCVSMVEYDIADVRPCSGKAQHEPAARTVPRSMRREQRP